MGIHEAPRMADSFGVPTFYVTDIVKEDAGAGNVRIMNCQLRNGILIPQCEIIVPAVRLLAMGREASAFALELYHREQGLISMASSPH